VTNLFFQVSGEHPTLPFAELRAILKAEGFKHQVAEKLRQVIRIKANAECVKPIFFRAALTRICNIEVAFCNASAQEIFDTVGSSRLENFLHKTETFVVRVRRIGESSPDLVGNELEKKLGEVILDRMKGTRVHLTKPDKTFFGVLTDNKFIFGLKLAEIVPKPFMERRPRKRPFFHPSAMPAKLARCMVNLAQPEKGDLVLDPFCGTATMLIEAGLIGCRVIGLDAKKRMIKGSRRNLEHFGIKPEGLAVADAKKLPIEKVDCIVTDPPYGRASTTMGHETAQIVEEFLSEAYEHVPKGKRICIASPKTIHIKSIGRKLGFKPVESHSVYVHRSLIREIAVLERS
jgi:tRNA (guanine10-N2)-dimethyltransferase